MGRGAAKPSACSAARRGRLGGCPRQPRAAGMGLGVTARSPNGWLVGRRDAPAADLHRLDGPPPAGRSVCWSRPTGPALVLGSTQRLDAADHDRCLERGVAVVRRGTGGGAVLVEPGEVLWVDVFVPRGDSLWLDDVGRSFLWLGDAFAAALRSVGLDGRVHPGPLRATAWSSTVCFAGLGYGEVTVAGAKMVGLAQRRTRAGALFQCAVAVRWRAAALVELLRPPRPEAAELAALGVGAADLDGALTEAELFNALLDALPA